MTIHRQRRRRNLLLHFPFSDPANPLQAYGGALTFARAHDATHLATYVNPATGLVTDASADELRVEAAGALIESARTNLSVRSEIFYGGWGNDDVGEFIQAATVGPDGLLSGVQFRKITNIYFYQAGIAFAPATTYCLSVHAKIGTGGNNRIVIGAVPGGEANFNLAEGDIRDVTCLSASMDNLANGWRRLKIAFTGTPGAYVQCLTMGTVAAGEGHYWWGSQVEQGATPSSYIGPTAASAISRTADALTFPAAPGALTSFARINGTTQEINYAAFAPMDQYVRDVLVMNRTFSAGEIAGMVLG